jgi:hypothetical protein
MLATRIVLAGEDSLLTVATAYRQGLKQTAMLLRYVGWMDLPYKCTQVNKRFCKLSTARSG